MPRGFNFPALVVLAAVHALLSTAPLAKAQTVWSGYGLSYTKASFVDATLLENQDRITSNVWITRGFNEAIYNIRSETFYSGPGELLPPSPVGTRWATYINNAGETIAATNYANLNFENQDFITAYGGAGGMSLPGRLTGGNAVLHLVADNIYLDIRFTSWASSGGGGFSYDRSLAPAAPQPTGDYNGNGFVDAADYVVWRNTLNQPASPAGSGADGNSNNTIDPGDYTYWRARFGNPVPGAAAGSNSAHFASVPEPALLPLLLGGLLTLATMRIFARSAPGQHVF